MTLARRLIDGLLPAESALRRGLRAGMRNALPQSLVWRRALPSEVAFWAEFLRTRGLEDPQDFQRRFDTGTPLIEPLILDVLEELEGDPVRIIDVGAGPATWLGTGHAVRRLAITAVDPLGVQYADLLGELGLRPPVPTLACTGERLLEQFKPASFEIAYARNALDHSADPVAIIANMLELVRPGGWVLLRHYEHEALTMRYEELHQWNFELDGDRPVIWNRRGRHDLRERFGARADVSGECAQGSTHARWVVCRLRRHEPGGHPRRRGVSSGPDIPADVA